MIKMAVFDLDGTLINSLVDLAQSVNKGLKKAGLEEKPIENFKQYLGDGRAVLVKRAMGEACADEELEKIVYDTFNAEYVLHCNDNTAPYEGCAELLSRLSSCKIKTAVHSNKPDEFVGRILAKVYPNHSFTAVCGQKPQYKPKSDSEALLDMLDECGVSKDECIYIGDSNVDVYTAKNAGIRMVGVEWGFRGRDELLNAGTPYVAKTTEELYEYISGLNE
ncbi:MAG: HAD family hydrolase [Clostridiales bacterium]|nr:HAD family hydrolase [Clostridiales bacterium]